MNKVRLGVLMLGLGALIFFMLVRLPASIGAQSEEAFGAHTLKGSYGFTLEGVMYVPGPDPDTEETIALPFNMLGQIVADGEGNIIQGTRTLNFGGDVEADTVTGTYSVNSDGTGSLVLDGIQDGEQVAVEEFDCFFTPAGDQFECTVTRIARVDFDPPQEFPIVALATGLQQSTDIPQSTVAAVEDLVGVWERGPVEGANYELWPLLRFNSYLQFNEDGTYRATDKDANLLDCCSREEGQYRLESTSLSLSASSESAFCKEMTGTYEVKLVAEDRLQFVLLEDPCAGKDLIIEGGDWARISP